MEIEINDKLKVIFYPNNVQISYKKPSHILVENAVLLPDESENPFAYEVVMGGKTFKVVNDNLDAVVIADKLIHRFQHHEKDDVGNRRYIDGMTYREFHGDEELKKMVAEYHRATLLMQRVKDYFADDFQDFVRHLERLYCWANEQYNAYSMITRESHTYPCEQGAYADIIDALACALRGISCDSRVENEFRERIGLEAVKLNFLNDY